MALNMTSRIQFTKQITNKAKWNNKHFQYVFRVHNKSKVSATGEKAVGKLVCCLKSCNSVYK